jgi:fused signal recognition particle receptor
MFDLKSKLRKTREGFVSPLRSVFGRRPTLSAEDEETIEELLLGSDMGVDACERVMDDLKNRPKGDHKDFLREEFLLLLRNDQDNMDDSATDPRVIVVTGVNGVGKTTSIAKLTRLLQNEGKSVLLAAADTFRAAATEQLAMWAHRLNVDIIRHKDGGDPAAVAFDACNAAQSRRIDVVIVDTAGRLHTRVNLMEELKKIKRACEKVLGPGAVETLLALDATLGQNSLVQAKEFTRAMDIQGIILTKIDSTAKGGIVIAIRHELGVPVRYIGAGEGLEDFSVFSPEEFVDALLEG